MMGMRQINKKFIYFSYSFEAVVHYFVYHGDLSSLYGRILMVDEKWVLVAYCVFTGAVYMRLPRLSSMKSQLLWESIASGHYTYREGGNYIYQSFFQTQTTIKAWGTLTPKARKENHTTTFSLGCTIALLATLILIIHIWKILKTEGFSRYMENIFPLYSWFGFIIIHMAMYACNIYFWRCYCVNYSFIFGFKHGTELGYREIFLITTGLASLALASVIPNLDMERNEETKDYQTITELLPIGLVTIRY